MNTPSLAPVLDAHFRGILERHMQDVPIVNPDIEIESRAWCEHNGQTLCVMITPWFMSIMLFPPEALRFSAGWKTGDTCLQAFPAGVYEFTAAVDEEIGFYQSCSLFSPMFEFSDHALATDVADAAMQALFKDTEPDADQARLRALAQSEAESDAVSNTPTGDHSPDDNGEQKNLSRRDLFRTALRRGQS